jgi:hypothetical protein
LRFETVKEIGITWWRIAITAGVVSAVNVYGFIAQLPKSFWPLIDAYFLSNYFLILGLSFAAVSFFTNWAFIFLRSLSFWLSNAYRRLSRKAQTSKREPDKALELLTKIFIFSVFFGSIFSGSKFVNDIIVNAAFIFVCLLSYYFYVFVTRVNHGIPLRSFRKLFDAWIDDLAAMTSEQLVDQARALLPIILLLLTIYSYKLGQARAVELMRNDAYSASDATGDRRTPLAVTSSGVIFLASDKQSSDNEKANENRFIFVTFSGDLLLSSPFASK